MNGQQQTTALGDFERYRKPTRREQCLVAMNQLVPWSRLTELVEPMYPTGEGAGRPLESNSGFEAFVEPTPTLAVLHVVDGDLRAVSVLALNNGNRTKTARDLGVDPRTIFRYLEREPDAPEPSGND